MGGAVKKGYTILEVVVAMALLAIVLPGLIKWVTSSRQTQVGSFRSEQATEYAQYVLDSLRTIPRGERTDRGVSIITKYEGRDYVLVWNYLNPNNPYAKPTPGAMYVEVHWKNGSANRVSRLDGVLP